MKVKDIGFKKRNEVSMESDISFRFLHKNLLNDGAKERDTNFWILEERETGGKSKKKMKDQFTTFQKSMKVLLVWGQFVGLNPVTGILQNDVTKMRFSVGSWKCLYAMIIAILQIIAAILCAYRLFGPFVSFTEFGYVTFFLTGCCTTLFFIRIAAKWPNMLKEVSDSRLDEYVDPNIIKKCNIACVAFTGIAFMEYLFSILSQSAKIIDCGANVTDIGSELVKITSMWFYELDVPYTPATMILTQFIHLTTTATWNYSDIFIICISLYLTSILKQINKRIVLTANKNYMPTSKWEVLREDYTRATRLVKLFDDMFSGVIIVTFANDLFFICLQLFNILARVKSTEILAKLCPNYPHGPLKGYEYHIYMMYSTVFLFTRFLTVSLAAAGVNTASKEPAAIIYRIPSSAYTQEVERFLHQVNSNVVALSGLQFFYITRELVLTIAATIVTYELVLLQFSSAK